jgi:hypothetical protein
MPVLEGGLWRWVDIEEFDSCDGIRDWGGGDHFAAIVEVYLAVGHGKRGLAGAAKSYLFDAQDLTAFGVGWMERKFGVPTEGR